MILLLYNTVQIILLLLCWPVVLTVALCRGKYRRTLPARLGLALATLVGKAAPGQRTIWLHALSVGEVTSAIPLLVHLKEARPNHRLIVSVSTESGFRFARERLHQIVDAVVPSPLDLYPVVQWFIRVIKPNCFILVETDFWPNTLACLQRRGVPSILVNGRISSRSFHSYQRFSWFFAPLFQHFSILAMQTERDRQNMLALGLPPENVVTLGNLKYVAPVVPAELRERIAALMAGSGPCIVAGSTHAGEEECLLNCLRQLLTLAVPPRLVLVPRNPQRADELIDLAEDLGLSAERRSAVTRMTGQLLIVDTIGELAELYTHADIAYVGGSLVPCGGHNPLEPAINGIPVVFGPHMEDFEEIVTSLLQSSGARQVVNCEELQQVILTLLTNEQELLAMISGAARFRQRGDATLDNHVALITRLA